MAVKLNLPAPKLPERAVINQPPNPNPSLGAVVSPRVKPNVIDDEPDVDDNGDEKDEDRLSPKCVS